MKVNATQQYVTLIQGALNQLSHHSDSIHISADSVLINVDELDAVYCWFARRSRLFLPH